MLAILLLAGGAGAATLTVDDSGGANYTRIQDAIDNASAGDTILVYSGTYFENVNVNKRLILRGIGMPVVDARGSGRAITLAADGIILEGFTATKAMTGISVTSNNNTLTGNNASSNNGNVGYGISLQSSSNNRIYNNIFNNTNNVRFIGPNINSWNTTLQFSPNIIGGPTLGGNFWAYPNGTVVFNEIGVITSSYTNSSTASGTQNVTAMVSNSNGSAMKIWDWIVTPVPTAGNISGFNINDINGNGKWDTGEAGIQGWNITLKNAKQAK